MDREFRQRMERNLRALEREIVERLNIEYDSLQNLLSSAAGKDTMDVAEEHFDRETLELLGEHDRKRLRRVSTALQRLHTSGYGICRSCGKPISQERLEAIPDALLCIDCQREREGGGKRWIAAR
ncbi:MAG: TraR/DksA family transcriptional regulator [Spirochaetaceae bacterium]